MARDEELQALARARAASPEDVALMARHARALARQGDIVSAEAILVEALDVRPGHPELTAELDALAGGRLRGAPWPSPRATPWRSARSTVVGPTRGEVVARVELDLEEPVRALAVPPFPGPLLPKHPGALVATREGLFAIDTGGDIRLVAAVPRELEVTAAILLPAGRVLLLSGSQALVLVPGSQGFARVSRRHHYGSSFAVGSSGLLHVATRRGHVDALALAQPAEARTIQRTEPDATVGIALAPGGDVLVAVEGDARLSRPAGVARLASDGALRWRRELGARSLGRLQLQPVIDGAGTVFVAFPGERLLALDAAGGLVFEAPDRGEPAGIAGGAGDVLVLRHEHALVLVDARTGRERGRLGGAFYGAPKIDARGWVFARRGDDLVAWDPASPARVAFDVPRIGERYWDFAFAADGRCFALVRRGDRSELVVIE